MVWGLKLFAAGKRWLPALLLRGSAVAGSMCSGRDLAVIYSLQRQPMAAQEFGVRGDSSGFSMLAGIVVMWMTRWPDLRFVMVLITVFS
jgi:hypothetical protein